MTINDTPIILMRERANNSLKRILIKKDDVI